MQEYIVTQKGQSEVEIRNMQGATVKLMYVGHKIVSAPICSGGQLNVVVENVSGGKQIQFYDAPHFALKRTQSI